MGRIASRISVLLAFGLLLFTQEAFSATDFPKQTVQFVVGAAPGGSTDLLARLVALKLAEKWNQAVVVQNRPGAAHRLAADFVSRAKPDGYTIFVMVNDIVLPAPKNTEIRYDPVKSFAPIALLATGPACLAVAASVPANSVKELVELVKTQSNKLNFSANGNDGPYEMGWRRLMSMTGIKTEVLRYPGGGPALVAVLGEEARITSLPCASLLPSAEAGKVKIIAITERTDAPLLDKVPTFEAATGKVGFDGGGSTWYGLVAPAGTPKEIITKIHDDVVEVLGSPDVKSKLLAQVTTPNFNGMPEDFGELIKKDTARWETWSKDSASFGN